MHQNEEIFVIDGIEFFFCITFLFQWNILRRLSDTVGSDQIQ